MQEGGTDGAKSALSGFQQMVQNQLTKMENDFKNGKPFPDFPVIQDHKAFHVRPGSPSLICLSLLHIHPGSLTERKAMCSPAFPASRTP